MAYLSPGVYVEEVPGGPRPIEGVGTSMLAVVGVAPDPKAPVNQVIPINNWDEFCKQFAAGGGTSTHMAYAVFGFFNNGGTRCYCVNIGNSDSLVGSGPGRQGIDLLEEYDNIQIVIAPGFTGAHYADLYAHVMKCRDRFAIFDVPLEVPDFEMLKKVFTIDPESDADDGAPDSSSGLLPPKFERGRGAVYYPWIRIKDPLNPSRTILAPPSGHMAGVYARVDGQRGIHKAPANEMIAGALGLSRRITPQEQAELNPLGVNCIREFGDRGILAWGARTLSKDPEWKYINVRRLFTWIEKSIEVGTQWVVFEPNNQSLWKRLAADVENFLKMVWRQGALMGGTPQEAFFVQCNNETNPPEAIDAGQLCIRIGIAPVKPAEFVIFRISQSAVGAEVEIEGESEGG